MLADFLFSETHIDDAVMVSIGTDPDGLSYGRLTFPVAVLEAMSWDQYPSLLGPVPVASAIAYGLIVATKGDYSLVLTGDRRAWCPEWGVLIDASERLPHRHAPLLEEERLATRH